MLIRLFVLFAVLILAGFIYSMNLDLWREVSKQNYGFQLVDPEQAPENIKSAVLRGYKIMMETKKYLPEYAGDRISCTNCHFAEGNTLGGEGGGISLVGVTRFYTEPYALQNRINACFSKSLHGKPLPVQSEAMKAIVTYLEWISAPTQNLISIPWRGVKLLRSHHIPHIANGKNAYATYCADCHGANGQGEKRSADLSYPPLWGESSFTKNAGMGSLVMLASFVYANMPYEEPHLTVEDALDVAAFIVSMPHPMDTPEE